jgi:hypothetical protein
MSPIAAPATVINSINSLSDGEENFLGDADSRIGETKLRIRRGLTNGTSDTELFDDSSDNTENCFGREIFGTGIGSLTVLVTEVGDARYADNLMSHPSGVRALELELGFFLRRRLNVLRFRFRFRWPLLVLLFNRRFGIRR